MHYLDSYYLCLFLSIILAFTIFLQINCHSNCLSHISLFSIHIYFSCPCFMCNYFFSFIFLVSISRVKVTDKPKRIVQHMNTISIKRTFLHKLLPLLTFKINLGHSCYSIFFTTHSIKKKLQLSYVLI